MAGSDQSLWLAVLAADESAFDELYLRYRHRVFSFHLRWTLVIADAEDLTNETFTRLWEGRRKARLDERAGLLPWLLGIAHNLVREHVRRLDIHRRAMARFPIDRDEFADVAERVIEQVDQLANLLIVRELMASMSAADHEILSLHVIGGLNSTEIATALGIPASTARSRISRALASLRARFRGRVGALQRPDHDPT